MVESIGLEALQVWQKAMNFALRVQREILSSFPPEEKWAMSAQLRRAAQSIPANTAEGYGRYYYQETVRFCYIARGSLEEAYTYIKLADQLGYISENIYQSLNNEIVDLRRLINGYIAYLKKNKRGENEPGSLYRIQEDPLLYSINHYPDNLDDTSDTPDHPSSNDS